MKTKIFLSIILSGLLTSCVSYIDLTKQVWAKIPKSKRSQIQFYNSTDVNFSYEKSIEDSMDVVKGKLIFIDKDQIKLRRLSAHTPGVFHQKTNDYTSGVIFVQFDNKLNEGIPFSIRDESNVFTLADYFVFEKKEYKSSSSGVIIQARKKDLYKLEHSDDTYQGIKIGK